VPYTYIHCCAHILNLVLVDCSKRSNLPMIFCLLKSLYIFMTTSKAHLVFVAQHRKSCIQMNLHMNCKSLVINAGHIGMVLLMSFVTLMYDSLLSILEKILEGPYWLKAAKAHDLLLQVKDFKLLVLLIIFDRGFNLYKKPLWQLSKQLDTYIDLGKAADLVLATEYTLQDISAQTVNGKRYLVLQRV